MMPGRPPAFLGRWGENITAQASRSALTGPGVSVMPGGSAIVQPPTPRKPFVKNKRLPFTTYKADNTHVKVTGGMLMRGVQYADILIADSSALTVANGDKVWLQRDSANTWTFSSGSAYPTDKLYYPLATIAIDGTSHVLTVTLDWPGGHMVHDNELTVTLVTDSGSGGGAGVNCDFTYTVKTEDSATTLIASGAVPVITVARALNTNTVTAATMGTMKILSNGTFKLWSCDESVTQEYLERDAPACP